MRSSTQVNAWSDLARGHVMLPVLAPYFVTYHPDLCRGVKTALASTLRAQSLPPAIHVMTQQHASARAVLWFPRQSQHTLRVLTLYKY